MNIKKIISATGIGASAVAFVATLAAAATTFSLFGAATIVTGGNPGNAAQLVSNPAQAPGYAGVDVDFAPMTWASLTMLSTDYNVTDDNCGGGSPRFQINVDTNNDNVSDGNVFVALGPSPSFTGCTTGWQTTGNMIGNSDAGRYDFGQFGGSTFTTYSNAPSSVTSGKVVGIQLVVDGSWNASATAGDSEQTVLVDNVKVNSDVETFDVSAPTIITPAHNATVTTAALTQIDWSDVTGATEYQYEAYSDPGYTNLIYSSGWLPTSSINSPGTPPGEYYIRVRARNANLTESAWSNGSTNPHHFTVTANSTVTPTISPTPISANIPAECQNMGLTNVINGTNNSDYLLGTPGNDLIFARGGSDYVEGNGGSDCIVGGDGSDYLVGGAGNDVLLGQVGSDALTGGLGNDRLFGGADSDSLRGEDGNDTLDGQAGSDAANGGANTDTCTAESETQCEL